MPWFYERSFFVSVMQLLNAGDVAARLVAAKDSHAIQVTLEDDTRVIWGNQGKVWAYTHITKEGDPVTHQSETSWDSPPDEVAQMIATHAYGADPAGVEQGQEIDAEVLDVPEGETEANVVEPTP